MTRCKQCDGRGSHYDEVRWSDGLGGVEVQCLRCRGTGSEPSVDELLKARDAGAKAAADLRDLRQWVALYLAASENRLSEQRFDFAPNPAPYASTWRKYLVHEAQKVGYRGPVRRMLRRK